MFGLKSIFLLSVMICISSSTIIRDYNAVDFKEIESFQKLSDLYLNSENYVFNQNVMLGVADEICWNKLESPAFRGTQRHSGGGPLVAASLPASEFPYPEELLNENNEPRSCANILFYRRGDSIASPAAYTDEFEHSLLNVWLAEQMRVKDMHMTNHFNFPIEVFWQEESMDPVLQGVLQPGESTVMSSFIGHIFSASSIEPLELHYTDVENPDREPGFRNVVDYFVVDGDHYYFSALNRLETCEIIPGTDTSEFVDPDKPLDCSNMYLRLLDFTHKVFYAKRLGLNYVQPQFVRAVTDTGFEHRQLPAATFQWLKSWYDHERLQEEIVESSSGPCMNQHVAPSGVTHLPAHLKTKLSDELRDILQAWHGAPLDLTSIYGVRRYNNGSVLRMHVDTVGTHVVSAIINVDQEVEQDWPLLILDHKDNEHNLVMRPGDMVLYESAKLLHGRPTPFIGKHYDNIFIHYKPVSGWNYDWL